MYEAMMDWLQALIGSDYEISRGQYVEDPSNKDSRIAVLYGEGGPAPMAGDRSPRFRVLLLGPAKSRGSAQSVSEDIQKLMDACEDGVVPCGAANIRAITEPVGPGYTADDRAWLSVTVEVQY